MREINGRTRVCGLLANPVEHTLSPLLHQTLAERTGINMAYVPFKPEPEGLDAAVKGAYELNILGLNVSVPYKQQVIASLKETDGMAAAIGAVNTLVRIDGGYKGYNTDIMGLRRAMELEGVTLRDRPVALLGAGGVAKAVACLCAAEGAAEVCLLNRTIERAEELAAQVNQTYGRPCVTAMELKDYKQLKGREYLAIQTTSVGMYPETEKAVIEDRAFYERLETAYDLVYTPFTTRFMKYGAECGARTFNGLRMLVYQGVCAYELWNQISVPKEDAEAAYERLRRELGAE